MIRLITLCFMGLTFFGCGQISEEKNSTVTPKESPHDFMFMQRAYPTGEIKTDAYSNAIAWKKNELANRSARGLWEFTGPVNTGGRITDIEIPVDQAQTYYVGAASGGIFKTTNAGATWIPIFDEQEMLSIGDIEISKNNTDILWVGTGEVNAGGGSLAYDGDGIYTSTDGGITWDSKGLPDVGSIGKVLIDPNDENTIFVGAMGPLFRDDDNRGVYKTTDGGDTWDQVLFLSDITGVIDMANHPTNSDVIYAASWERVRRPQFRTYGGATSGLHRSLDGGTTWTEMTNGLPSAPNDKGRISIDISQSNPDVLYARYADAAGAIQGVYRTADGGDNWNAVNSNQLNGVSFHWWFRGIFVDPSDENTLYNVDFIVEKSTDGGQNWSVAFPNVHVDQHAMAFNASVPGEVLLGNDGGFYKSTNDGASSVKDVSLPITQFYRFYVDPNNPNKIYGGTQDNNTIRTQTGSDDDWQSIFGGDGFQPLVDPNDTNTIYALSQRGNLGKSTNNGTSFVNALNGIDPNDRNNWDTPITFDPQDSQTLYYGTQRLWKTTNGAATWASISGDLTNGPGGGNLSFGTIISIDVSQLDSDLIYIGTDDGNVWVTEDGGGNWTNVSSTLPDRWVTKVKANPFDVNEVFVTLSGYRYGEDEGHVYYSNDRGATWTDISDNLPNIPVNDIEVTEVDGLFLATDIGVMQGSIGGNWQPYGTNMPSVVVTDLYYDYRYGIDLYAATYGRSSYRTFLTIIGMEDFESTEISLYPNPTADVLHIDIADSVQDLDVAIYNQLGQVQQSQKAQGSKVAVDVSTLADGVYVAQIKSGNKQITKKFIKK